MKRIIATVLAAGIAWLGLVNCVGSFALTGKLHGFVRGIGNKWVSWLAFLVCALILPLYSLTILIDVILLNSIEFWSGSNPVSYNEDGEATKVAIKGDTKSVFHYSQFGKRLNIRVFKKGKLHKEFLLKKEEPGVMYLVENGKAVPIGMRVEERAEGRYVEVYEGEKLVHTRTMSRAEVAVVEGKIAKLISQSRALAKAQTAGAL